jgi:hypothetical protein
VVKGTKKGRIYDGGKSVIHVKNSTCSFYKNHKSGRLGRNCEFFNLSKKTCDLRGGWCNNSSICSSYKKKKVK